MTSKARPAASIRLTRLPDPPEDERDMQQFRHASNAAMILRAYFSYTLGRSDVLASGEGYLCRRAGEARRSPRPDCLVALNLPIVPEIIEDEGNGYTIEEIGQSPDFVLEVGSATTGRRDYREKRDIYAGLEVREYWRFDHTGGRYHDVPLAGDLLVEGRYQPIPVEAGADGVHRGYSPTLGLELHWVERRLRFFNPAVGEYLPDMEESLTQRDQAESQRDQAQAELTQTQTQRDQAQAELTQTQTQRDQAQTQRDQAQAELTQTRTQRDQAEARVRELEEEIRRLQGQ